MTEVCSSLNLDIDDSFYVNLGNDRPNITSSVFRMNGGKDYTAVDAHLPNPDDVKSAADLPKTIIFTNVVKKTQVLCRHVRRRYSHLPHGAVEFLHAHRTAKAKRRIMKQFRKGKIKILIATEAAGMVCTCIPLHTATNHSLIKGADIPDIELVIQFGVPSSLSVWTQRAGRAGRSPGLQARAILLVETSMFQQRKKRKRAAGKEEPTAAPDPDSSNSDSLSDSEEGDVPTNAAPADDGMEWGKNVDSVLRKYISSTLCRRELSDQHFNNPPRHGKSSASAICHF
jgi:bloom syndrome protein